MVRSPIKPLIRAAVRTAVAAMLAGFVPTDAPGLQLWLDPSIAPSTQLVRRNLFDQSSNFTDAFWWQDDGGVASAAPTIAPPAPAPWAQVHKFTDNVTGETAFMYSNWDIAEETERRTFSIYLKKADAELPFGWIALESADVDFLVVDRNLTLGVNFDTGESCVVENYQYDVDVSDDWFNLPPINADAVRTQVESVGNGWYRLQISMHSDPRAGRWFYRFGFAPSFESITSTAGLTGKGGYMAGAQFEDLFGSATLYQNIGTYDATDQQRILLNESLHALTLFQESTGITPVTAVEQPVGLFLDKSKSLVRGIELAPSNYAAAIAEAPAAGASATASQITFAAVALNGGIVLTPSATVPNSSWVEVRFTVSGYSAGSVRAIIYGTGQQTVTASVSANGIYRFLLPAAAGGSRNQALFFQSNSATAATLVISAVSIREVPGYHGTQATVGARPIYCARFNQLTKSEQLGDATWGKTGCTITDNTFETLDKIVEDTSTGSHRITSGGLTAYANMAFVSSFRVKAAERSRCVLTFSGTTPWAGGVAPTADFDLATGQVVSSSGCTPFIIDLLDGTYRIGVKVLPVGSASFSTRLLLHNGTSSSYTGTAGSGLHAGQAQTSLGTEFYKYQWIDTATVYDTDPAFPRYLRFDSAAHYLNFTLPALTACTIVNAFMVESAPAFTVYGFNNINTTTNVGFGHSEDSATLASRAISGTGSALQVAAATDVAILPHVVTVTADGTTIRSRVNNGAVVSAASATNFGSTSWRLGRTLNDVGSVTGRCYQLFVYNGVLDAANEDGAGRFAASKLVGL